MNAQEVIELEQSHVLGVYGRAPFVLEWGEGSTLYDLSLIHIWQGIAAVLERV